MQAEPVARKRSQNPRLGKGVTDPEDQRDDNVAWLWGLLITMILSGAPCFLPTEAPMLNGASIPSFWSLSSLWSLLTCRIWEVAGLLELGQFGGYNGLRWSQ